MKAEFSKASYVYMADGSQRRLTITVCGYNSVILRLFVNHRRGQVLSANLVECDREKGLMGVQDYKDYSVIYMHTNTSVFPDEEKLKVFFIEHIIGWSLHIDFNASDSLVSKEILYSLGI